jgi:glycosyltransferase involved in cell wall biosynthesis
MERLDLSVLILTYNESLHLDRCLNSLQGKCKRIFIVDSFSTDSTVDIANRHGAHVIQRKWTNYADQFQWGLDNCPIDTEWVMRLDADEYLEPELLPELEKILPSSDPTLAGYYIRRKYFFLGKWVKFGAVYPLILLRVWRHKLGRIEQRWMDEHIVLKMGTFTSQLQGHIVDDNLNNTRWWTDKHNKYADREMLDIILRKHQLMLLDDALSDDADNVQARIKRFVKERIYNRLPVFVRPFLYFLYRYFLRLGFLDGVRGFAFHFFQGYWYRSLVDLRVYEAERLFLADDSKEEKIRKLEELTGLNIR